MPRQAKIPRDIIILLYALLGGAPAVAITLIILWCTGDYSAYAQWTFTILVLSSWLGFAFALRTRVTRPLQTMSNLLAALREGDFSIRAAGATSNDPLGEVLLEINSLGTLLQEHRLGALEATALLRTVMEEIDVAIFAFDANASLRLVNRAGQELLAESAQHILGRSASELGLADCLEGDDARVLPNAHFPGGTGRWGMRRTAFREGGRPHFLVVIADLSQALRAEELKAWQRLVRVLGHELNNSLAPIKSIAGSLGTVLRRKPRPDGWENDMRGGLEIIEARADNLTRFLQAYADLARLPAPKLGRCEASALIKRIVAIPQTSPIEVLGGPDFVFNCDAAQIEQLLINLLKNASEAAAETGGKVRLRWSRRDGFVVFEIEDDGPGLANPGNLFVPFFTTKPTGTGIGLVLSRQIAENHGGTLHLENRTGHTGCIATLQLPATTNA
ncbi:MAG TPA: ATP-binding protein [Opitutaceae bacterium]|nr:ATP-binding protein [Opitutaceae bacterium]